MTAKANTVILIPIYNDWQSASLLTSKIEVELLKSKLSADILFVNDDSSDEPVINFGEELNAIRCIEILNLRRNLGHQRAIAIGLTWANVNHHGDNAVVMDGDGEDRAEDIPKLMSALDANGGKKIVFAERTRRTESLFFKFFYQVYCFLHFTLAGIRVRVGNFSAIPAAHLERLAVVSELWNHYAAAVFKAKIPYEMIPLARGNRLAGKSRMNFSSLVIHGLSAISVFGDVVGIRLLGSAALFGIIFFSILLATITKITGQLMPFWMPLLFGLIAILFFNLLLLCIIFVFMILTARQSATFIPMRDYSYYIRSCENVFGERK